MKRYNIRKSFENQGSHMKVGRKFRAKFADNDSKAAYMTYSAGQALVYNACAEEARYFDFFAYRYGETQQKDVRPVSERNEPARRWECFSKPQADQKYSHLISDSDARSETP